MRLLVTSLLAASLVVLALACGEGDEAETPTPAITVTATPRATPTPRATVTPDATLTPEVTPTPELTPAATPSHPGETPAPSPPLPSPTPTTFTAHFIDVGQGDATLIEADDTVILVDGGDASANVEYYLQVQGIQDIDLMVATHPHAEAIGGLIDVLAHYDVHEIWTNGDTSGSQTYGNFALAVAQEQADGAILREVEITRGYVTSFDGLDVAVLHPQSLTGDTNEDSLVLRLTCGTVDILLTGDATADSEADMLTEAGLLTDVDILKVGHHGSNTSTSHGFLAAVTPEKAVISVGAGNTYGHPHQETLDRLAAAGAAVYRTDLDGTVTLTFNWSTYSIATSSSATAPTLWRSMVPLGASCGSHSYAGVCAKTGANVRGAGIK